MGRLRTSPSVSQDHHFGTLGRVFLQMDSGHCDTDLHTHDKKNTHTHLGVLYVVGTGDYERPFIAAVTLPSYDDPSLRLCAPHPNICFLLPHVSIQTSVALEALRLRG